MMRETKPSLSLVTACDSVVEFLALMRQGKASPSLVTLCCGVLGYGERRKGFP